jgi:predicted DNA-binding transcriptional regulator AlpA
MRTLIRPGDLARELCVSRAWVYDAANRGRIPSIRIGGADGPLRFVAEDVERWLDEARAAWRPGRSSVVTRMAALNGGRDANGPCGCGPILDNRSAGEKPLA